MPFCYTAREKHKTLNKVYTPTYVSDFIYKITKHLKPKLVFDPACGMGSLLQPWIKAGVSYIGIDNDVKSCLPDWVHMGDFENVKVDDFPVPDLVIANGPWCAHWSGASYPEVFLRKIVELWGKDIPIVFLCPFGLRLNSKKKSKRRQWFMSESAPTITSVISCPLDLYPDTVFHSEIILFNIKKVKPHYWCPNETTNETTIQRPKR